jgi:hypothetical protein
MGRVREEGGQLCEGYGVHKGLSVSFVRKFARDLRETPHLFCFSSSEAQNLTQDGGSIIHPQ